MVLTSAEIEPNAGWVQANETLANVGLHFVPPNLQQSGVIP